MFLVRSAFWLTIGFMLVAPTVGADIDTMGEKAGRIAQESQQALATGVKAIECDSLECMVGRAVVVGALESNATAPAPNPAPVPPPRPDWAS